MGELINGRTPEEIKRELRWAAFSCGSINCEDCEYHESICSHTTDERLAPDALALIERLEAAQPKWISVKERLPEENQTVLVWADGCASIAEVYDKDMLTGEPVWSYTGLGTSPWYWMPLPEPPKGD